MREEDGQVSLASNSDKETYKELRDLLNEFLPTVGDHWNWPIAGYMTMPTMQRLLNLNHIYDLQINSAGSIMEFGLHSGSSFAQLINLRSIKEPYNHGRHLFGFDTFTGFATVSEFDKDAQTGDFYISSGYQDHLQKLCELQERLAPKNHLAKFTLLKGDAPQTLETLLNERPELLVSLAIFDMDVYKPTKAALKLLIPRLHCGSILVFDQLNCPHFPGETKAVFDAIGVSNLEFLQSPFLPYNTICRWRS